MSFVDPKTAYISYREYKPFLYKKWKGCQACKNDNYSELVLHHVTYERYGTERATDLRLLCYKCHDEFHQQVKGNDPDLRYLTNLFIKKQGIWASKL